MKWPYALLFVTVPPQMFLAAQLGAIAAQHLCIIEDFCHIRSTLIIDSIYGKEIKENTTAVEKIMRKPKSPARNEGAKIKVSVKK